MLDLYPPRIQDMFVAQASWQSPLIVWLGEQPDDDSRLAQAVDLCIEFDSGLLILDAD